MNIAEYEETVERICLVVQLASQLPLDEFLEYCEGVEATISSPEPHQAQALHDIKELVKHLRRLVDTARSSPLVVEVKP